MFRSAFAASALVGVTCLAVPAFAQTASLPITDVPGATDVRIWEVTSTVDDYDFPLNNVTDTRIFDVRGGQLTGTNRDVVGWANGSEYYDVYLSDSAGAPVQNGACVTIAGRFQAPNTHPAAAGFNIARVDVMAGSIRLVSLDQLPTFTPGASQFVAGSELNVVDNDPATPPTTWSNLGEGTMSVTVCRSVPNMTLQKALVAPANTVVPGDVVTFDLIADVDGAGLGAGQQITLTDSLPSGLSLVSTSGTNWTCATGSLPLTCTYTAPTGGVMAGSLDTLTVTATVDANQPRGPLDNCATLAAASDVAQVPTTSTCATVNIAGIERWYAYPVKYLCGWHRAEDIVDEVRDVVADGRYRTEINIINTFDDVDLRKSVLPLVTEGERIVREPDQIDSQGNENFTLRAQHATLDDCRKLGEMMGGNQLANSRIHIGYLNIFASAPIDVTAVYTTAPFEGSGAPHIDVEQITGTPRDFIVP